MSLRYVIVSGGVLSGLGKGVTASSIGVLLKSAGLRVTSIKIDPYLNSDAGTMSPFEHGEVFVLDDGGEVDLDLGNYERFLDLNLARDNNLTTGKVYSKVLEAERRGDYLGKTVQVIPHITDAVQDWIIDVAKRPAEEAMKHLMSASSNLVVQLATSKVHHTWKRSVNSSSELEGRTSPSFMSLSFQSWALLVSRRPSQLSTRSRNSWASASPQTSSFVAQVSH